MMKKVLSLVVALIMVLSLAACATPASTPPAPTPASTEAPAAVTLKVAAIETAYGAQMWTDVCAAFTAVTGIEVQLTTDKNLEDVIGPSMKAGDFPDVIHLATGREDALTETFIKDNNIAEITDVLSMTVPGETKLVSEKIAGGFTETSLTNPSAPMRYAGLKLPTRNKPCRKRHRICVQKRSTDIDGTARSSTCSVTARGTSTIPTVWKRNRPSVGARAISCSASTVPFFGMWTR